MCVLLEPHVPLGHCTNKELSKKLSAYDGQQYSFARCSRRTCHSDTESNKELPTKLSGYNG